MNVLEMINLLEQMPDDVPVVVEGGGKNSEQYTVLSLSYHEDRDVVVLFLE